MKWRDWLDKWGLKGLKINVGFLEMEFSPTEQDRHAAWELYVELVTRVTTQYLAPEDGDEAAALESVHSLFPLTREALRRNGVNCHEFAKIAIVVLNQVVRPFTAKWHGKLVQGQIQGEESGFRDDLRDLQQYLSTYTRMLGEMAGVQSDLRGLAEPHVSS